MSTRDEQKEDKIKKVVTLKRNSLDQPYYEVYEFPEENHILYIKEIYAFIKEDLPFIDKLGVRGSTINPTQISSFYIFIKDLWYHFDSNCVTQANQNTLDVHGETTTAYTNAKMKSFLLEHNLSKKIIDDKIEEMRIKVFSYLKKKAIEHE